MDRCRVAVRARRLVRAGAPVSARKDKPRCTCGRAGYPLSSHLESCELVTRIEEWFGYDESGQPVLPVDEGGAPR